jgi:simple sugar transport system ATP-binding protein
MLVPTLTLAENAALGHERVRRTGLLDLEAAAAELGDAAARLGQSIDPGVRAGALSVGEQQRAEITMVVARARRVLILDEPTALLAPVEVEKLLVLLRRIADDGGAIILVTHKLDEVVAVADAITVLRLGRTVAALARGASARDIARAMVGGEPPPPGAPPPPPSAAVLLEARELAVDRRGPVSSAGGLRGVSLAVRAGEILGIAGVEGNGQTELAHALVGLAPASRGGVRLAGDDATGRSVDDRRVAGLAHIPEDRQHFGLVLDATLTDNIAVGRPAEVAGRWRWLLDRGRARALTQRVLDDLDVRPADPTRTARTLSGGNQQKLIVGRELGRPGVRAVVAAQPTRGVDLAAQARIHDRLRATAAAGAAVLVISADLDELFALCHRVAVLHRGHLAGELAGPALRETSARDQLGRWMVGA